MSQEHSAIKCLHCGRTSYNRNDIMQKFCGHCHKFHANNDDFIILNYEDIIDRDRWITRTKEILQWSRRCLREDIAFFILHFFFSVIFICVGFAPDIHALLMFLFGCLGLWCLYDALDYFICIAKGVGSIRDFKKKIKDSKIEL